MVSGGNGINKFIGMEDIGVDKGGMTQIHTKNLNTSGILQFIEQHRQQGSAIERTFYQQKPKQPALLRLQVVGLPQHGILFISKEKAVLGQLFTQLDIDRGFVNS
jgi:hypothetical protein